MLVAEKGDRGDEEGEADEGHGGVSTRAEDGRRMRCSSFGFLSCYALDLGYQSRWCLMIS